MEITDQFAYDFDWFFVDSEGQLCHVASAAGRLPTRIGRMGVEEIQNISRLIRLLPAQFEYEINPRLDEIKSFESNLQRTNYLEDFILFAKRGLYSFDKSKLNNFEDPHYHLVAYPKFYTFFNHNFKLKIENENVDFMKFRVSENFRNRKSFLLNNVTFID